MTYPGFPSLSLPATTIPERGVPGWLIIVIPIPIPVAVSARWVIVGIAREMEADPPIALGDRFVEISSPSARGISTGGRGMEMARAEQDREINAIE